MSAIAAQSVTARLVRAEGIAATYGGPPAIEDVTFDVAPGERVAVLGPNGGGKTTLFRAVLAELRLTHGTLELGARAAAVPQTERSRLDYPVTALDVALMGTLPRMPWWRRPGRAERSAALDALATVGLRERAGELFGELSGGQRQRVLVARALVQEAGLLLLDEPFTGLDVPSARQLGSLLDELARLGRGVMIATHDMEQALESDRVLCLNRRQVAFGPPRETLTRPVLERTYGGALVELPEEGSASILPPHHHEHGEGDAHG